SRRRHTRSKRDWSSDVCSSDLLMSFFYFFCGGIRRVDQPSFFKLGQDVRVDVHALRLTVRLVWAAGVYTFIPAQTQPGQGIQDGLIGLFRVTSGISIFNTENQLSASVSCISPIEKSSSHHTNVRSTSGRRAKAYAYFLSHTDNVRPPGLPASTMGNGF